MSPRLLRSCINTLKRSAVLLVASTTALTWACAPEKATEPSADAVPSMSTAAAASYSVVDLGTLGGTRSRANDINNAGIVVGSSTTAAGTARAFRWKSGVMTDLGTLGGSNANANAINNDGVIVGWSETRFGRIRAVRWANGVKTNLGTLGGRNSEARDVNDLGWIVGLSQTTSGDWHAFIWKNGVMTDLGTLGGRTSSAWAINRGGVVVGQSATSGFDGGRAFRWRDGTLRALRSPGMLAAAAFGMSGAYIVGSGDPESGGGEVSHALLWVNGVMQDLGRMSGIFASAFDVNLDGIVVGHVDRTSTDCSHGDAFVWKQGSVTFLPKVGGATWAGATAINGRGQVVGFSETDIGRGDCVSGDIHAVLWRPN